MKNATAFRTFLLLCLALLAAGCASTSKVMLAPARAPIHPEQVRIYYTPPTGAFEEIAVLETASGGFTWGDQNKMNEVMHKLRVAAAGVGANGLLLQDVRQGYSGGGASVGVGTGRFGGRSYTSGGIGVNVTPTPKQAAAIAIYVPGQSAVPVGPAPVR